MSELLDAVKESPTLLGLVVAVGLAVYAIEKLGSINGPISRALRAWESRKLRKLRREAMLRAEQRRIEVEQRDDREAWLLSRLRAAEHERDTALRQLDRARRVPLPRDPDEPSTRPLRRESARGRVPSR